MNRSVIDNKASKRAFEIAKQGGNVVVFDVTFSLLGTKAQFYSFPIYIGRRAGYVGSEKGDLSRARARSSVRIIVTPKAGLK